MSGYLARIAARAGGMPAAAGPRLPSRFEPFGADAPTDAAAPAPETSAPPPGDGLGALRREERELRSSDGVHRSSLEGEDERGSEPGSARHAIRRTDEVGSTPAGEDPAARGREREPGRESGDGPAAVQGTPLLPDSSAGSGSGSGPSIVVLRRGVAAQARVEAAPPRRAAEPEAAPRNEASATAEPDVVHVTIERVEVRAAISAAAQRAHRPPRESERSLHDYLAGRTR